MHQLQENVSYWGIMNARLHFQVNQSLGNAIQILNLKRNISVSKVLIKSLNMHACILDFPIIEKMIAVVTHDVSLFSRLTFPSIFIVYSVIALGALDTFVLIGFRHRTSLFCSSRNLLETVDNETLFCSIQGKHEN